MHKFDYSFLKNGLISAKTLNMATSILFIENNGKRQESRPFEDFY